MRGDPKVIKALQAALRPLKQKSGKRPARKSRMRMEIKQLTEEGTFEGMLSPYGNVDDGGDIVEAGAYTKTLQEQGTKRPLLWQHKTDCPIGDIELEERPGGLWCKGALLMELPEAKKAYLLIKAQIVQGLSIGFESIKDSIESGVRHLKEIKLYEGSIVTFPMNESALIASVKSKTREAKGDFNQELAEIQTYEARWQMFSALQTALGSAIWASALDRDAKIGASQMILEQFADAYMAMLPAYLDLLTDQYGDDYETWGRKRMEVKEGRTISAATNETLLTAHGHMTECMKCVKSAMDVLAPLLTDEAEPDATEDDENDDQEEGSTSKSAAGREPEPDENYHSAAIDEWISSLNPTGDK